MGEKELDSSAKLKILKNTVAKCPEIVITTEGVSVNCLIDTGSEVTTIIESFFKNLLLAKPQLHEVTKWMRVMGANNLDIQKPKMRVGIAQSVDIVREAADDVECEVECVDNEIHVRIEKIETSISDNEIAGGLSDLPFRVDIGDVEFTETQKTQLFECFISIGIVFARMRMI